MSKRNKNRHQPSRTHDKLAEFWLTASEQTSPNARLSLLRDMAEISFGRVSNSDLMARRYYYEQGLRQRPLSKRCFVCAGRATQQHHVLLLSLGGENSYLNLVPICRPCHEEIHPWMREATELEAQNAAIERECEALDESYRAITSPYPIIERFVASPDFVVTHAWLHGPASSGNGCGWTHQALALLGVSCESRKGPKKGWLRQCVGRHISYDAKAQIEAIAARAKGHLKK